MALSATEIRDRAANDLGMLRVGQSLQAQDATRVDQAYAEVFAALKTKGLAPWASTGDVPDEFVPHVVALVADNCLNTYSTSNDRYKRIKNAVAIAMPSIQDFAIQKYTSTSTPENF
jgi:hypothetical protein